MILLHSDRVSRRDYRKRSETRKKKLVINLGLRCIRFDCSILYYTWVRYLYVVIRDGAIFYRLRFRFLVLRTTERIDNPKSKSMWRISSRFIGWTFLI